MLNDISSAIIVFYRYILLFQSNGRIFWSSFETTFIQYNTNQNVHGVMIFVSNCNLLWMKKTHDYIIKWQSVVINIFHNQSGQSSVFNTIWALSSNKPCKVYTTESDVLIYKRYLYSLIFRQKPVNGNQSKTNLNEWFVWFFFNLRSINPLNINFEIFNSRVVYLLKKLKVHTVSKGYLAIVR